MYIQINKCPTPWRRRGGGDDVVPTCFMYIFILQLNWLPTSGKQYFILSN